MDKTESDYDDIQNIKIILLGNSGVGKTSILWKYNDPSHEILENESEPTIGYEYITIKHKVEKSATASGSFMSHGWINIHIWDTTGQDRFNSIVSNYYRRTSAAVWVYDVTDRDSFESIEDWVEQLHNCWEEDPVLLLIGNKADKTK